MGSLTLWKSSQGYSGYDVLECSLWLTFYKLILGSLSSDVFERRTSTGSEVFSLLTCLDDIKFVFLSFFTVIEAIWLKICAKPPSKNEKRPLPVDVRRSKTLLLKLPISCLFTLYLLYFQINYLQKLPTSPRSYEKGHCHAVCEDRLLWWGKRICSRKGGSMTGPLERRNFNVNTTKSWSIGFNQKHITLGLYNSGSILLCCLSENCLCYKTHTGDH